MELLENAVEAIKIGVEDYEQGSPSRLMSAVRNIHAGILLLFKEALLRLSPPDSNEALIKSRILPTKTSTGAVLFVGHGKLTVNTHEIEERFRSLDITADWARMKRIGKARNEIEHYVPNLTKEGLRGVIADAFLVIRQFIQSELDANPHELLGESTWQSMLNVAEVYQAEMQACIDALDKVDWGSETLESGIDELTCDNCGSGLLKPDSPDASYQDFNLVCTSCGDSQGFEEFVPKAVATALPYDAYQAMKDGDSPPYCSCPTCGLETYVVEEERCASCGEEPETTCIRCGSTIIPEELLSSPMCGWCAHMSNKDD